MFFLLDWATPSSTDETFCANRKVLIVSANLSPSGITCASTTTFAFRPTIYVAMHNICENLPKRKEWKKLQKVLPKPSCKSEVILLFLWQILGVFWENDAITSSNSASDLSSSPLAARLTKCRQPRKTFPAVSLPCTCIATTLHETENDHQIHSKLLTLIPGPLKVRPVKSLSNKGSGPGPRGHSTCCTPLISALEELDAHWPMRMTA